MSALKSVKGDDGRELVRVLTGEEELEGLTTPKVSTSLGVPEVGSLIRRVSSSPVLQVSSD